MSDKYHHLTTLMQAVDAAVGMFCKQDVKLLELFVHEQAMAHRIAVYLEWQFDDVEQLNFDCEYNQHLKDPKRINIDLGDLSRHEDECIKCPCGVCKKFTAGEDIGKLDERLFRPDIIVHSRGNHRRNLIAIEVKKEKFCPFDAAKIKALTKGRDVGGRYGYQLGVFVSFPKGKPSFKRYAGGKLVRQ